MQDLTLHPISQANRRWIAELMDEEEGSWLQELDWEYAPIRRILDSFIFRHALPGYAALGRKRALGYTYFLMQRERVAIGALYALPPEAQSVAEQLLTLTLRGLKEAKNIHRIEAQLMPLNGLDLPILFTRHGFEHYEREYLELDLSGITHAPVPAGSGSIAPWTPACLPACAEIAFRSYRNELDATICADYRSLAGCDSYLRSLVEHPGCGVFLPEASFVSLDQHGAPTGFILVSRISQAAAMIPQISIAPSHQGLGTGSLLIGQALRRMRESGFKAARLTVTRQNRRAYEWYHRLGFRTRCGFGAYVWQRRT